MSSCSPIVKWSTARGEFFWCATCDIAYRDREGVVEHTLTHFNGVEPQTCFECLESFLDRKDLQEHIPRCNIAVTSRVLDANDCGSHIFW